MKLQSSGLMDKYLEKLRLPFRLRILFGLVTHSSPTGLDHRSATVGSPLLFCTFNWGINWSHTQLGLT